MKKLFCLALLLVATCCPAQTMTSPNGKIKALATTHGLNVDCGNVTVARITRLGITPQPDDTTALCILGVGKPTTVKADYYMLSGKKRHCTNQANEYRLNLGKSPSQGLGITLIVRLYNDGLAFRYATNMNHGTMRGEQTTFDLSQGTPRWMMKWTDSYEEFYPKTTDGWSQDNNRRWAFPVLANPHSNVWTLLTEADIHDYNSAACLYNTQAPNLYRIVPDKNDSLVSGPWMSPWRVMIMGSLADVVESTLVTDVAPPSTFTDNTWIHPGMVSWIYWAHNHGSKDFQIVKQYIDMAATMHLPYVLIDAEWDEMDNGGNVEDALRYAHEKGVKPLLWYNSCCGWVNGAPGPKWRLNDPEKREKEFAWCEKMGVAGVKIDFFGGDTQPVMRYCIDLLNDAARHHLLVNFHGATLPRGWQRTFPNLLSTEAVYGAEWYNNRATLTNRAAGHNATLPFTRNVVGPMDYTPCAFSNSQHPHITTDAHEVALTVLFESALQHLADRPESFLQKKYKQVCDFLGTVPTTWDDTKLLTGYPAHHVVMARRKAHTWYVAGINGTDEELGLTVDLSSLQLKGRHTCRLLTDGSLNFKKVKPLNTRTVKCAPRGGFVMIIE